MVALCIKVRRKWAGSYWGEGFFGWVVGSAAVWRMEIFSCLYNGGGGLSSSGDLSSLGIMDSGLSVLLALLWGRHFRETGYVSVRLTYRQAPSFAKAMRRRQRLWRAEGGRGKSSLTLKKSLWRFFGGRMFDG